MDQTHDLARNRGRGVVLIDQFCHASGASRDSVESLITAGTLDGLSTNEGNALGLFEDSLPSAAELRALGLSANDGYRPTDLLSLLEHDADDQPKDNDNVPGPTWAMSWPDA